MVELLLSVVEKRVAEVEVELTVADGLSVVEDWVMLSVTTVEVTADELVVIELLVANSLLVPSEVEGETVSVLFDVASFTPTKGKEIGLKGVR